MCYPIVFLHHQKILYSYVLPDILNECRCAEAIIFALPTLITIIDYATRGDYVEIIMPEFRAILANNKPVQVSAIIHRDGLRSSLLCHYRKILKKSWPFCYRLRNDNVSVSLARQGRRHLRDRKFKVDSFSLWQSSLGHIWFHPFCLRYTGSVLAIGAITLSTNVGMKNNDPRHATHWSNET